MVRQHHPLNGHEFNQTPGDGGQRILACYRPQGHKELQTTQQLNNKNKQYLEWRRERRKREKDSERYPIFNEVIPDFQHAVTFLVLSLSEIYFQTFSRPLIYPISLNLPCLRQVHIPCQACRRPLGLRGSILTRSEEPHLQRIWSCLPLPPSLQPLPPVKASVSKITLGTDKALVTRGNQLPLDRKWLSIIS